MTVLQLDDVVRCQDDDLRNEIGSIFEQLVGLHDLEPGSGVDALLSRLVRVCVRTPEWEAEPVLSDPVVRSMRPRLHQLCGRAEYLLERHWARSIVRSDDPRSRLTAFPYLGNYQQLTALEVHLLAGLGCDLSALSRICFLGGGPLPLSALLLGQRLDATIDIVDRDAEATGLANEVIGQLGSSHRLRAWTFEALEFPSLGDCDVAILAALVGADRADKRRILAGLAERMRPGSMLVARGAHGLRTLLYPTIDAADLPGWTPLGITHPFSDVVNSVLVARRS